MKKAIAAGVMAAAALVFTVPAQAAPKGNFVGWETPENGATPQQFLRVQWLWRRLRHGPCAPQRLDPNFTFDGANWVGHRANGTVPCMFGTASGQSSGPVDVDYVINPAFSGGSATYSFHGGFSCGSPDTVTRQVTLAPVYGVGSVGRAVATVPTRMASGRAVGPFRRGRVVTRRSSSGVAVPPRGALLRLIKRVMAVPNPGQ